MSLIVLFLAVTVAAILQLALPAVIVLGQAKTPMIMAVVLYYALNRSPVLMLTAAIAGGLISDSLEVLPLGFTSGILVLLGFAAWKGRASVFHARFLTHAVFGALGGVSLTLLLGPLLVLQPAGLHARLWPALLLKAAGCGLGGLLVTPRAFPVLHWLDRWTGNLKDGDTA